MREAAQTRRAQEAKEAGSFEAFFAAHHAHLVATLCLVAWTRSDAEDAAQDAFFKVYVRWERVSAHEDPVGYLYRAGFNQLSNRRRQAARVARKALSAAGPVDPFSTLEERDELVRALRELSLHQRAAVVLTDLLDLPSEEAAQVLGIRASTVRTLASQGRAHLREKLGGQDV